MYNTHIEIKGVGMFKNDTDAESGYQAGLLGKERVLGRLYDRNPPEHLYEPQNAARYALWMEGYRAAQLLKAARKVEVLGRKHNGELIQKTYKGWSVDRAKITLQFADVGCVGDVVFCYMEGVKEMRKIECGI